MDAILVNYPNVPPMIQANEVPVLNEIVKMFKPFEKLSEGLSSEKYVSGNKAISMIRCSKEYLETIDASHELSIQLKSSLINKLKERFEIIQNVYLFWILTFLDPCFKILHVNDETTISKTVNYIKKNIQKYREPMQNAPSMSSTADDVDNGDHE